jgi:hypothetical protein
LFKSPLAFLALGLSLGAHAQTIDQSELRAFVQELVPEVERRTGRSFVQTPDSAIVSRRKLKSIMSTPSPALQLHNASALPVSKSVQDHHTQVSEAAVAVYVRNNNSLYVVKEGLESAAEGLRDDDLLNALVRCTVVQELTHALQAQYSNRPEAEDIDVLQGRIALVEGYASVVASAYCHEKQLPVVAQHMPALVHADIPSSLTSEAFAAKYAWGKQLVNQMVSTDAEAIWRTLDQAQPLWTDIVTATVPQRTSGWDDPEVLLSAVTQMGWTLPGSAAVTSPVFHMAEALGNGRPVSLPKTQGGLAWTSEENAPSTSMLLAVLFEEAGAPATLLASRRTIVEQWKQKPVQVFSTHLTAIDNLKEHRLKTLTSRADVKSAFSFTLKGNLRYSETWLATEHALLVVASDAATASAVDIEGPLGGLLEALPQTPVANPPTLPTWVLGAERPAPAGPSAQFRLLAAGQAKASEDADFCGKGFGDLLESPPAHTPNDVWDAAYFCYTDTDDFDVM